MAAESTPAVPGVHGGRRPGVAAPVTTADDSVHGGVAVAVVDGVTTVRFWGSVDLEVRAAEAGGLGGLRGASPMTLDCRDVEFMDSTGLSVLVRIVRDAAADGRDVRFLGASGQVRDLLATTGVDVWMAHLGVRSG